MPPASAFAKVPQPTAHAMQDWRSVAVSVADRVLVQAPGLRVLDLRPDDRSPFATIFSDMVAAELVSKGVQISLSPTSSSLALSVKPVMHPADGETMPSSPGERTAPRTEVLASAVLILRGREVAVASEILYAPDSRAAEYGAVAPESDPAVAVPNISATR